MSVRLSRLATLGIACLTMLLASPAWAQAPEMMPYQGFLSRADGAPYEGVVTISFRIYDGPNAAAPVWQEEIRDIPVSAGKFAVELGRSNPVVAYVSDGRTRYLGMSVNGEPEATPRQPVGSVPYALFSRDAAYLGGQRADQYITIEQLTQRNYVNEARVIQLIEQHAGGGAGVDEERVIELIREHAGDGGGLDEAAVNVLIDARNYVTEERVQQLINEAVIAGGEGLNADQVNQLIDARGYLDEDAITVLVNALIDARGYLDADAVNALIDARGYLDEAAIIALIDARVGAAVANIQNEINQLRQQVQNIQNNGNGVGLSGYILGVSNQASNGRLSFNNRNGIAGADEMCRATYAEEASAHLCTWGEVERAVATRSWPDNPNFNGVATWTIGPVTLGAFGTSLSNTCQNLLYSSGDVATGTTMTVRLDYRSNGNQGNLVGDVFSVGQNVACGGNFRVLCCR